MLEKNHSTKFQSDSENLAALSFLFSGPDEHEYCVFTISKRKEGEMKPDLSP